MKKIVITVIASFFSLIIVTGCSNETYTKDAVETHFINAIILASKRSALSEEFISASMYIFSKKIIEKQNYRDKALDNEKFFKKRFANSQYSEQELNKGYICVAKFYFDEKELNEMLNRVRTGVEKEKKSRYGSIKYWKYKIEKKLEKIKDKFN